MAKKKAEPVPALPTHPLRLEWRSPAELAENPRNWKNHPPQQVQALADVIAEVGWAGACLFNERTGRLIDGHARRKVAIEQGCERVPVLVGDWSEADEAKILATLDPLSAMAEADAGKLAALLADVRTDSESIQAMLDGLSAPTTSIDTNEQTPGAKVFADEQVIDSAFAWFRATGFPYRRLPVHVCMQEINDLAQTEPDSLLRTRTGYHVADTYHPHRFRSLNESSRRSVVDAFDDDRLLRRALEQEMKWARIGDGFINQLDTVSGTKGASNFRPGFALLLYRRFAPPGAVVLDTSTGYGGRLVAFLASGLSRYVGIDPNTETHAGNLRLAQDMGASDRVELHNLPAEDVPHDLLAGRCDFAFTSPPYFRKERYGDEPTQSWKRYPTGDAWRDGLLVPMMRLQFAALKPGSLSVVNVADIESKGTTYPLAEWTVGAAQAAGFAHEDTMEFPLGVRFGVGVSDEVATEPVLLFRKPLSPG